MRTGYTAHLLFKNKSKGGKMNADLKIINRTTTISMFILITIAVMFPRPEMGVSSSEIND